MKGLYLFLTVFVLSLITPSSIDAKIVIVSPGQNIQNVIDASSTVSGDIVLVKSGEYKQRWIDIKKSGITLQCESFRTCKTLSIEANTDNVIISGFDISDPFSEAGIRTTGSNNIIENNEIHNMKQDGIWFFGSNNTFRNNYIHNIIDPSQDVNDPHVDCFQTWDWSWDTFNILFDENICDHTRSNGSNQIVMLSGNKAKNISFTNNRFIMHDEGYSPLALYGGNGFKLENNYFCNTTNNGSVAVYLDGGKDVTLSDNNYTGYSSFVSGVGITFQTNNLKGSLPCVVTSPSTSSTVIQGDIVDTNDTVGDEVNIFDFSALVSVFGTTGAVGWIKADIVQTGTSGGKIDLFDFNALVTNFGL